MKSKIILGIILLCVLVSTAFSTSIYKKEAYNDIIGQSTLSEIVYNLSLKILNNETDIITIEVPDAHPFVVSFISNDYAEAHNITSNEDDSILFGQYQSAISTIYILTENLKNQTSDNETELMNRISNVFTHELAHHYQFKQSSFLNDIAESMGMDYTYIGENTYSLNNYEEYYMDAFPTGTWNLSDVPDELLYSVSFPMSLDSYYAGQYMQEVQVRTIALCFQERQDYQFYWNMIELKNYSVCNMYEFPVYVDNNLARSYELFITSYIEQYLGINIDDRIASQTESFPKIGEDVGGFLSNIFPYTIAFIIGLAIILGIVEIFNVTMGFVIKKSNKGIFKK